MKDQKNKNAISVGEIRPSQFMYTFGIGAIIDLPNLSTMILGLDRWEIKNSSVIEEPRLLKKVKHILDGRYKIQNLKSIPVQREEKSNNRTTSDEHIPVTSFPRWLRCNRCGSLLKIGTGSIRFKTDSYSYEGNYYEHKSCHHTKTTMIPVRYMMACPNGHLDDFPFIEFVHEGRGICGSPNIKLGDTAKTGSILDIYVECSGCQKQNEQGEITNTRRFLVDAFSSEPKFVYPCTCRHPHLGTTDENCLDENKERTRMKPIMLGATNAWFPVYLSSLSLPVYEDILEQKIEEHWDSLKETDSVNDLLIMRKTKTLNYLDDFSIDDIWSVIESRKAKEAEGKPTNNEWKNLRIEEWKTFINGTPKNSEDFKIKEEPIPHGFEPYIERVILIEKLRETKAFLGFTRLISQGEFGEYERDMMTKVSPISKHSSLNYVPAIEVRGEGIFIQFKEKAILDWCNHPSILSLNQEFIEADKKWKAIRNIESKVQHSNLTRTIFLHTFSHALMRQICMECGYSFSSIRERIYSNWESESEPAMAGILIYTASHDSEGTMGGLVSVGKQNKLEKHIQKLLESAKLCSSDPLCSEHKPETEIININGAACFSCLYSPETSCEKGNRFLDRRVLVPTLTKESIKPFFDK